MKIFSEPPTGKCYKPTNELAWYMDGYDERALIQKWVSDYDGEPDVWIAIPTYLMGDSLCLSPDAATPNGHSVS